MMDMYYSGDIGPKTKCGKVLHLGIALCSSRLLLMLPLKNRTAQEVVLAIMCAVEVLQFKKVVWITDPGTNFLKETKVLLEKLVGLKYIVSHVASHAECGIVKRIFEEINRHLRPLLDVLSEHLDNPLHVDAGVAMSAAIYNRMPHKSLGYSCPLQVFTPFAEESMRIVNANEEDLGFHFLNNLYALHEAIFAKALQVQEEIIGEYLASQAKIKNQRLLRSAIWSWFVGIHIQVNHKS